MVVFYVVELLLIRVGFLNVFLCIKSVILNYILEFVITAAACLRGHFAERHIKDIASDGLKIIVSEYKSPNGLGLVQFQPEYKGDVLQIAQEEPAFGDKCKLLGWDIDVSILSEKSYPVFKFLSFRMKETHIS